MNMRISIPTLVPPLVLGVIIIAASIGGVACTQQTSKPAPQPPTMTAPSPQPKGHEGRWAAGSYQAQACTACHESESNAEKAPKIPASHYINQDVTQGLAGERTPCVTCHVEQRGEEK